MRKSIVLVLLLSLVYLVGCSFLPTNSNIATNDKIEDGLFSSFDDVNNTTSFIGYGYNVITSGYMSSRYAQMTYRIFDEAKLRNANMKKLNETEITTTKVHASTMESFSSLHQIRLNASVTFPGRWPLFTGSMNSDFAYSKEGAASQYFYKSYITVRQYYLMLQVDDSEYFDMLSPAFVNDLKTLNVANLFEKYGTHLITSVSMGGRIDFNYHMFSTEQKSYTDLTVSIEAKIRKSVKLNVETDYNYQDVARSQNISVQMNSYALGGAAMDMSTDTSIEQNYSAWLQSIESKPALVGIKDINSLYPIWELLPDGYENRKTEIMDYFDAYGQAKYEDLLLQNKIEPPVRATDISIYPTDVDTGEEIDFLRVKPGTRILLNPTLLPSNATSRIYYEFDDEKNISFNSNTGIITIHENAPSGLKINITISSGDAEIKKQIIVSGNETGSYTPTISDFFTFKLLVYDGIQGYEISAKDNLQFPSTIVIPAYYNNLPVLKIADRAFERLSSGYYSFVIPTTIREIGKTAFSIHDGPTKPTLYSFEFIKGSNLKIIKAGAFYLGIIDELILPEGLLIIEEGAFYWSSINKIYIPSSVISIGLDAFYEVNYAINYSGDFKWYVIFNMSETDFINAVNRGTDSSISTLAAAYRKIELGSQYSKPVEITFLK